MNIPKERNQHKTKCIGCGTVFSVDWAYQAKYRKYCSKDCANIYIAKNRDRKADHTCIKCGKHFTAKLKDKRKYCSRDCFLAGRWGYGIGERADVNKHKIRSSTPYVQWRKGVLIKDSHSCQWCGENNIKVLQAHHIKPMALFPEVMFDVSNGMCLCKECHKQTDSYGARVARITNG